MYLVKMNLTVVYFFLKLKNVYDAQANNSIFYDNKLCVSISVLRKRELNFVLVVAAVSNPTRIVQ